MKISNHSILSDIGEDYLTYIGLVSAASGIAERVIRWSICELVCMKSYKDIHQENILVHPLIVKLDGKPAIDLLVSLYRRRAEINRIPEKDIQKFEKLTDKINAAFQERNAILHGFWRKKEGEYIITSSQKANRRLRSTDHKYTIENLRKLADDLLTNILVMEVQVHKISRAQKQ